MRSPISTLSSIAFFIFLAGGCASSAENGNDHPKSAGCDTPAVMHCSSGSVCHEFYSTTAADAVRDACTSLGNSPLPGGCGATYNLCCVEQKGSNDYPEGLCVASTSSVAGQLQAQCAAPDPLCRR